MGDSRPTPEQKYLQKKLGELEVLETRLAERELELHTLRGGLLAFEKQYETVVGPKFAELDELRFQISQRTPIREAPPTPPGPAVAPPNAQGAAKLRPRAKGKPHQPRAATPQPPKPPAFNPAESLKKLYRDVAKTLHPDLADDDSSRALRHQYMIRVNEAYEAGNEEKLLGVLQEWEHAPESVQGSGAGAELVRVIRKIDRCEGRLVSINGEIEQMQTSGVFGMKVMADEAQQFERDLLAEMSDRLDADIAAAKELLATLPPPPETTDPAETPLSPGEHHEGM